MMTLKYILYVLYSALAFPFFIQKPNVTATATEKDCNEPLILPGKAILRSTSSRAPSDTYGPQQAFLHNTNAWCPSSSNVNQYLEVDLGQVKMIKSMAIQGNPQKDEFIKTFSLLFGVLEGHWLAYIESGSNKRYFKGNTNSGLVQEQPLKNLTAARYVRLTPETWHGQVCARIQFFGCDADPLGRPFGMTSGEIPDNAIQASSYWNWGAHKPMLPSYGRLHWTVNDYIQCWAPSTAIQNEWLRIDLSRKVFITAVATQGRHHGVLHSSLYQWVLSFKLTFGNDTSTWEEYKENQIWKTFTGNTDTSKVVSHILSSVVYACYVRFHPYTWNNYPGMRVEVYSYGKGRLNHPNSYAGWCAKYKDMNQWLSFDLGHKMLVTAIVTQAQGNTVERWVTSYKVSHSLNGSDWIFYKDDDKEGSPVKNFTGNTDATGYVTNTLNRDILARIIRIHPVTWHKTTDSPCMRASALGRRTGLLGSPVFTNQDRSSYITAYSNQHITLSCEAVGDTPMIFIWEHKGQVIIQKKTDQPSLTLTNVTKSNEGFYNCTATNAIGTYSKTLYLHVRESFEVCRRYRTIIDNSRWVGATSIGNNEATFNERDWYVFKDNHSNFYQMPTTTCVPQNRCGAVAPGFMRGSLPTVSEGIVQRKVCFHSNGDCCHHSVDINVVNCHMFFVYNVKNLDVSWNARYCMEGHSNENSGIMFQSLPMVLDHHLIDRFYQVDRFQCMIYCRLEDRCKSFNHNQLLETCELNNATSLEFPDHLKEQPGYITYDSIL